MKVRFRKVMIEQQEMSTDFCCACMRIAYGESKVEIKRSGDTKLIVRLYPYSPEYSMSISYCPFCGSPFSLEVPA